MRNLSLLLYVVTLLGACTSQIERGELSEGLYTNNSLGIFVNFDPNKYTVGTLNSDNVFVNYNSIGNDTINLKDEATLVIFEDRKAHFAITLSIIKESKLPNGAMKNYLFKRVKQNINGLELEMTTSKIDTININNSEYCNFTSTYIVKQIDYTEKWRYAFINLDDYLLLISINHPIEKDKTPNKKILIDFLSKLNRI